MRCTGDRPGRGTQGGVKCLAMLAVVSGLFRFTQLLGIISLRFEIFHKGKHERIWMNTILDTYGSYGRYVVKEWEMMTRGYYVYVTKNFCEKKIELSSIN